MRTRLRSTLFRGAIGGGTGASGALGELNGYAEGFAFLAENGGGFGQVAVKDATTAANNKNNVAAHNLITQSGTSPKLVKQPDGTLAWSPHNLILQSSTFATTWVEVVAGDTTTNTSHIPAASSGNHYIRQDVTSLITGARYTYAIEVKANGYDFALVGVEPVGGSAVDEYIANIDLTDGTLSGYYTSFDDPTSATTITSLGDGWYRVEMTIAPLDSTTGLRMYVGAWAGGAGNTATLASTGDGTSGILMRKARLYRGEPDAARHNIETTTAAKFYPAFEWDASPDTGSARWRMLVEPVATNLALYASDFTNAAWVKTGGGGISAAKTATGPDGVANSASTLTASGANGTALQAITSASASRVTSVWLKRRTGTGDIDLTQDNGSTWTTQAVTSTWTRFSLAAVTSANPTVGIRIVTSGDEVDVALFSHEVGTVATSPIPTYGSTVTRAADNLAVAAASLPLSNVAHTFIAAFSPRTFASRVDVLGALGAGSRLFAMFNVAGVAEVNWYARDAGATAETLELATGLSAGSTIRAAGTHADNDQAGSVNGATAVTGTDVNTINSLTTFTIGQDATKAVKFNGYIDEIRYIPLRLTNATLQSLTT